MARTKFSNCDVLKKSSIWGRTVYVSDYKDAIKFYSLGAEKVILVKENGRKILLPNPYLN